MTVGGRGILACYRPVDRFPHTPPSVSDERLAVADLLPSQVAAHDGDLRAEAAGVEDRYMGVPASLVIDGSVHRKAAFARLRLDAG
jgi:hypothetical protein